MKGCPKCQAVKPLDQFYRTKAGKPHSWCRACNNQSVRDRRSARQVDRLTAKIAEITLRAVNGKPCFRCGVAKALTEFRIDARKADGRAASCEDCMREAKRASRAAYYARNLDKVKTPTPTPERRKEYAANRRLKRKRASEEVADSYVARLFTRYSKALRPSDLPKALIEAKRYEILISRITKESK